MTSLAKKPIARKTAKPATAERLRAGALFHLERYASSSENLRQVLMRRVYKSAKLHNTDPAEGAAFVDDIIRKFQELNILNDATYARMKVESLRKRGNSTKAIRLKLSTKGVAIDAINDALDTLEEETGDQEIHAAFAYVKRRRLGPYRTKNRDELKEKDMAALGRQGFSYHLARKLILAEDIDTLEDLIREDVENG